MSNPPSRSEGRVGGIRQEIFIPASLAFLVLVVYARTGWFSFVPYDDNVYVYQNAIVLKGLTVEGIRWAFTRFSHANWFPLTWISHMFDVELFGLNAGGHHLTSVLFHLLATITLFALLWKMTKEAWLSGFATALFAIHPLRAESVVWVAERKDVLCCFFSLLALLAYVAYAERRTVWRYLVVVAVFALALMSKPMAVTLPFVMLLLDLWPLRRVDFSRPSTTGWLVAEKIPLLVFSFASSVVTVMAQEAGGAVRTLEQIPLGTRAANAVVAYVRYIGKMFWPVDLAVFYPYTPTISPLAILGAGLLLLAATAAVVLTVKKLPFLATGWFWFLGTLVPVIGIVQVGAQSIADRYTYFPDIGLAIVVAWGGHLLLRRLATPKDLEMVLGIAIVIILSIVTWRQVGYWKNGVTLFSHAIEVTTKNSIANSNLGMALLEDDRPADAVRYFDAAVRIAPNYLDARINLANTLARLKRTDDAIAQYEAVLKLDPRLPDVENNLGVALAWKGDVPDAVRHFNAALKIDPRFVPAILSLGRVAAISGHPEEALRHFDEALRISPGDRSAQMEREAVIRQMSRQ